MQDQQLYDSVKIALAKQWSPPAFLNLCATASNGSRHSAVREFCELVLNKEWQLLFDYCAGSAVAES
jgi:hypothetical protein